MINLLNKSSIGLDIADETIEVAELRGSRVQSLGWIKLPLGIVERGRIKDPDKLARAVRNVFLRARPRPIKAKKIIFNLPESQVFIHTFELKDHQKEQRNDLVFREAQKNIPISKENLLFSYKILSQDGDKTEILLIAASREVVLEWQKFFQGLGLEVEVFDIEPLAVFRGLFAKSVSRPVCLVDIGAATTDIAIFDEDGLRYSYSIETAGHLFTQEIANKLGISMEEAEKEKKKINLSDANNQLAPIIIKHLGVISGAAKTLINYFQEKSNQKVEELILVGGSSRIKGIVDYFSTNFVLSTRIGQSSLFKNKIPLEYLGAVGAALKGTDKTRDPAIEPVRIIKKDVSKKTEQDDLVQDIKTTSGPATVLPGQVTKNKLAFQKKVLIIIVIVGIVLVGLAFVYRSYQRADRQEQLQTQEEQEERQEEEQETILSIEEETEEVQVEPGPEPESELEPESVSQIEVSETETGWLNAREGAGTNYPIIMRIYPGETYPLLEETEKWYKIELEENLEGWIFNQYAIKMEGL